MLTHSTDALIRLFAERLATSVLLALCAFVGLCCHANERYSASYSSFDSRRFECYSCISERLFKSAWEESNLNQIFEKPRNVSNNCNFATLKAAGLASVPCRRLCVHLVHQTIIFGRSSDDHIRGCFDSMLSSESSWNLTAINSFLWKEDTYCRRVNAPHIIRSAHWPVSDYDGVQVHARITACFCRKHLLCNQSGSLQTQYSCRTTACFAVLATIIPYLLTNFAFRLNPTIL